MKHVALSDKFRDDRLADIDRHMQSALAPVSSNIISACLPGGQEKPFPHNCFSLMVLTGAKGSMVNHSQVRLPHLKTPTTCWEGDIFVLPQGTGVSSITPPIRSCVAIVRGQHLMRIFDTRAFVLSFPSHGCSFFSFLVARCCRYRALSVSRLSKGDVFP